MATAAAAEDRSVSIGRAFGRAFACIAANPLAMLAIAFLFGALPTTLLDYVVQTYGGRLGGDDALATIGIDLASSFGKAAITTIAQGALVQLVIVQSKGGRASFGDSVGAGLAVALPLVAMAILASLGMILGMILLIIPGVILYVSWTVAASALVEERLGPVEALKRSSRLTEGARWKAFALLLVMIAATWTGTFILETVNIGGYANLADAADALPSASALIHFVLYSSFHTVALAIWGVVQTSLYVELRAWKEGHATETLAHIFS